MNASSDRNPETIRSEIGQTRQRMDDTMDALGDRLQPRHLLDEVLGYFRADDGNGSPRLEGLQRKITAGADQAMHSVVETVKKNPMPALLIGGGIAWLIYESRRTTSAEEPRYDPDAYLDRPLDYSYQEGSASSGSVGSKLSHLKEEAGEKARAVGEQVKEKLSDAGEAIHETYETARARVGDVARDTKDAYRRTRRKVVTTAEQHPLEVGLVGLAAGLITGLLLPTPTFVNRTVGRTSDRLRDRARESGSELLAKGKRVAQAAVSAVKDEAQAQGLTPARLGEQATAVAERGAEAGQAAAQEQGLAPPPVGNESGSSSR
jgi:ElaB/YqjD/DUF883 family membrane-anchored ribosome-binding protein